MQVEYHVLCRQLQHDECTGVKWGIDRQNTNIAHVAVGYRQVKYDRHRGVKTGEIRFLHRCYRGFLQVEHPLLYRCQVKCKVQLLDVFQ